MNPDTFILVPTVGDRPADILRTFDGQSEAILVDSAACQASLLQGVAPEIGNPSPYEAVPLPSTTCVALEAAARQSVRLGLSEMAQVLTAPNPAERRAMETYLADTLAPSAPQPGPVSRPNGLSRH